MTYPGITKERDADFRQRIDNAESRGDTAAADNIRFQRYEESKQNLGEKPLDRNKWQDRNDRIRENQRVGRESENAAREELSTQLGENLSDNNTGDACKVRCGDNNSRPDSMSENYVHEHKHLGGNNDTVYNTAQMKAQRKWAQQNSRRHVVTISSDRGSKADGTPDVRPSGPLAGAESDIYYYESSTGQITHTWSRSDGAWVESRF